MDHYNFGNDDDVERSPSTIIGSADRVKGTTKVRMVAPSRIRFAGCWLVGLMLNVPS